MQKFKKTDFSNVHVYIVEFIHQNKNMEFHHLFAISIKDARKRAQKLKKCLFDGFIPLSEIRTIVFKRSF